MEGAWVSLSSICHVSAVRKDVCGLDPIFRRVLGENIYREKVMKKRIKVLSRQYDRLFPRFYQPTIFVFSPWYKTP